MSNFTPLVIQEYKFEGDNVKIEFSRLKRKDMLASMPALKRLNEAKEADDDEALSAAMNDVLNGIVDVMPGYVVDLSGLNDSDGNPVAIETVCEEYYFMKLAIVIAVGMLQASSGTEGKV